MRVYQLKSVSFSRKDWEKGFSFSRKDWEKGFLRDE
jgi:hypothetical protein